MKDQLYFYKAKVINVVDGDTIDCEIDLGFNIIIKQRLRLSNIDTPERSQEGFLEAKNYLKESILNKTIILKIEDKSKWGYYLACLYNDDSEISINEQLVRLGFAKEYHGGPKT